MRNAISRSLRDGMQPAKEGPAWPIGVAQRDLRPGLVSRQIPQRRQAFVQQRRVGAAMMRQAFNRSAFRRSP